MGGRCPGHLPGEGVKGVKGVKGDELPKVSENPNLFR
jgi:hypothetical protein